jgi:hypothetical protein
VFCNIQVENSINQAKKELLSTLKSWHPVDKQPFNTWNMAAPNSQPNNPNNPQESGAPDDDRPGVPQDSPEAFQALLDNSTNSPEPKQTPETSQKRPQEL